MTDSEKRSLFFKASALTAGLFLLYMVYQGNPTVHSLDPNHDGKKERDEFFWRGQKMREEIDSNEDGVKDIWRIFRNGKPFELRLDTNHDGIIDVWARYGENGNLATFRTDTDFDGKIDFSGSYPFHEESQREKDGS